MPLNWLNRIIDHEVTPPAEAWLNITNELDKEITDRLKQKLLAHEETPPAEVLENIFNTLNKEDIQTAPAYIEKIRNYSQEAPIATWESIIAKLDLNGDKVFTMHPGKENLKKIYIWTAVAASIITVIIVALFPTTNQSRIATNTPSTIKHEGIPEQMPQNSTQNINTTSTYTRKNNSTTHSKTIILKQPIHGSANNYQKGSKITDLAQDPVINNKEKLRNTKGETPMDIALMNSPNTYISITGADGQTVKVSSKFSNLIDYLTDKNPDNRENIEIIIEEGPKWKKIFAEWRNKMTNNVIAPSLSNFMDVIELSKVLEKQNN